MDEFVFGLTQLSLHAAEELFVFSFFPSQVIVGQITVFLLYLSFEFVPPAFYFHMIHNSSIY